MSGYGRDPFRGYDQWKTASPYDDDYDFVVEHGIATMDLICPACQETAKWFEEYTEPSPFNDLTAPEPGDSGWHCENCDWQQESHDDDYERLRKYREEFAPKINEIRRKVWGRKRKPSQTVDEFFAGMPDGDFRYDDGGEGDWHVYCCGEKDCPAQWHRIYPTVDIGRENGRRYVDLGTTDDSGNHDLDCSYDEREPYNMEPSEFEGSVGMQLANQMDDFFAGWAEYWLDCAETGTDPLGEAYNHLERQRSGKWMEFCLESAESFAKYLEEAT